jgi:putative nucleotidyltransferase with HDIG domain
MSARIQPPALPGMEPLFAAIQAEAQRLGTRALVVGGYVRDRLLGGQRASRIAEVDVLVEDGKGLELAAATAERLGAHPPVLFERFGTAHARIGEYDLEFVSTRAERYDPDSRKPTVRPASLEEDVKRRDFTINTLLMDWDGTVLDLTGRGLADLEAHRIMTPLDPGATFDEDPLRMLRAVRFATVLGFELDPLVASAIRESSARLGPPVVSMERIHDEFCKLVVAEDAERGLRLLDETGLLVRILPQLEAGKGVEQGGWHSHDVFGHSLLAAKLAPPDLVTRVAALLHDVGKPATRDVKDGKITFIGHPEVGAAMAEEALKRLRFSGDEIEAVARLVRLHMRPIQYDPQAWEDKAVRRLVRDAGPQLPALLELARADMRASHYPAVEKIDHLAERIRRLDAEKINAITSPLSGEELMARFHRPPGPWIKRVKSALEEAMVDGVLSGEKAEAWQYLDAHPALLEE